MSIASKAADIAEKVHETTTSLGYRYSYYKSSYYNYVYDTYEPSVYSPVYYTYDSYSYSNGYNYGSSYYGYYYNSYNAFYSADSPWLWVNIFVHLTLIGALIYYCKKQ